MKKLNAILHILFSDRWIVSVYSGDRMRYTWDKMTVGDARDLSAVLGEACDVVVKQDAAVNEVNKIIKG